VADVDRQQSRIVSPETLSAIVLNVDSVTPEGITSKKQATNFIVRQAPSEEISLGNSQTSTQVDGESKYVFSKAEGFILRLTR
jgi:hypothetical protein